MLLRKIVEIIQNNNSDHELTHEKICSEAGISRVQLFRKVKALTNMSVNEFIHNIKLKKAAEILRKSENVNINDLAFSLGFKKPGYFIELFKKKFGATPKAYNKKNTDQL